VPRETPSPVRTVLGLRPPTALPPTGGGGELSGSDWLWLVALAGGGIALIIAVTLRWRTD
jgi:hypothetical protein